MNDPGHEELLRSDAFWDSPSGPATDAINSAIQQAATPVWNHVGASPRIDLLAEEPGIAPGAGAQLPPSADDIVLDILPISRISADGHGRPNIEPDPDSLGAWNRTNREAAEHLVSWLNMSGTAYDAIENAIAGGSQRFERLSGEYDEQLALAGYDRFDPEVRACDKQLRELHDDIQHAKNVLADLRDRPESSASYLNPPSEYPRAPSYDPY
jgi:hypothetical protein